MNGGVSPLWIAAYLFTLLALIACAVLESGGKC